MNDASQKDLEPSAGDWAHTLAKAALSAIPILGGPAAELFGVLLIPPLAKRRDEWLQSIAEGLHKLEEALQGFKIESLVGNETFVTSILHASQAAMRSHQKEKLEALRNAVLNVAAGRSPDDDLQLMFLTFVDTLTPWHIKVLRFFDQCEAWEKEPGANDKELERKFPELVRRADFKQLIHHDLDSRGLTESGLEGRHGISEMGRRFIAFITSPIFGIE